MRSWRLGRKGSGKMRQDIHTEVAFREVQRFRQKWLWALLLFTTVSSVGLFAYGMYTQLILGQPWGDRPMSDTALLIVGPGVSLLLLGMTYLFYQLRLITEVRDGGLYLRFYPLAPKTIAFDRIKRCDARTYRPIREYGGWGIRCSRKGKAYNVSGNRGVQLEFYQGKPLLLGSQRADELALALTRKLHSG